MELESLFTTSKVVKFGKHDITIKQISLGDIPLITKLMGKFFEDSKKKTHEKIISLVENDFDQVVKIISKVTNFTEEQVPRLNISAVIFILTEVVKENADFLQNHVAPQLESLKASFPASTSKSKN